MCESAANLHGTVPLAVLTGKELVVSLQSVALVTEVLNDGLLGEPVAGRRVTAVAPVLWLSGGRTHWEETRQWRFSQSWLLCTENVYYFYLWSGLILVVLMLKFWVKFPSVPCWLSRTIFTIGVVILCDIEQI